MRNNTLSLEDTLIESPSSEEGLVEVPDAGDQIPEGTITSDELIERQVSDKLLNEGDAISKDISDARDDLVLLENIRDNISNKLTSGEGINETSAAIIQHTLEGLYIRRGFTKRMLPPRMSLENFKSKKTRMIASRITLESITDLIKNIGKYIVKKMQSFAGWFRDLWSKIKATFAGGHERLLVLKAELKKLKGMKDIGKSAQIKWLSKHVFGDQGFAKWDVAASNLKNTIRATDLERKAWKQIQEYLGNPNKSMKEFMKPDPYGLAKFSPYLGVGVFIKRNTFRKASSVIAIEVPSIPKLMEFIDDGLTLVGPAAVSQYENIQAEISRFEKMATSYKYETETTVNNKGKVSTTTVNKVETKKEFQIVINLARELVHDFWQMRCKAVHSVNKLTSYFINKFGEVQN